MNSAVACSARSFSLASCEPLRQDGPVRHHPVGGFPLGNKLRIALR
jgi:hypothetical protein